MVKGLLPITAVKYRRVTQVLYANEPVGNSSTEFNSVLFPQRQFTIIVASITASVLQVKKKRKENKVNPKNSTIRYEQHLVTAGRKTSLLTGRDLSAVRPNLTIM